MKFLKKLTSFHFHSLTGHSLRKTECDFLDTEEVLSIIGFSSAQGAQRTAEERNSKQADPTGEIFLFPLYL
jgi:hypothetical protein